MSLSVNVFILIALFAVGCGTEAHAGKRTVCTITVNSPDEKEMFRQRLPEDKYEFVELVERGRPDWLATACRQHIRCDLLIISGHFDGSTEFYSDQVAASEFLPVAEMERASCSDSCPGLFSQLKEVYLFGCNTLNTDAVKSTSSEVGRSLVRDGHSQAGANRIARTLDKRHGESSRDRMRRIFVNVPVIYGFSSVAPLGPTAATLLGRYLRSPSTAEVGGGRADPRLLAHFAAESMVAVSGLSQSDPHAAYRRDVCQFMDDRPSPAGRLRFVHSLLQRDMAEIRMFLERIEGHFASLTDSERQDPAVSTALGEIARDDAARDQFLRFAEDADQPQIRARMIRLAGALGWLSPPDQRAELVRMIGDLLEKGTFGPAEVDLTCAPEWATTGWTRSVIACRGWHREGRQGDARRGFGMPGRRRRSGLRLQAMTSRDDAEVQIAEVYLGRRPITDVDELRVVTSGIAHMTGSGAQVRALRHARAASSERSPKSE